MPIECKVTTISTWLAPITVVETARGVRFVDLDDGARQFRREAAGEYIMKTAALDMTGAAVLLTDLL